jgi:Short C-terminal domain
MDPPKRNPLKNAKRALDGRVGDARSKARAASHANVRFSRGETSFSAGAGAHADAGADAATEASSVGESLAQLERAEELHASGAITDAEYESLKTRLLQPPR